jgi:HK97 family phage major capsid protein
MEITHKQAVNRLKDIQDEIERLSAKADDGGLTPEDETYWSDLVKEAREVDDHRKYLEREADRERIRALALGETTGRFKIEPGSDRVDDIMPAGRYKNPWDLSEIRAGLSPAEQASEIRSRALAAIEKMPAATDERREVMTRFVERYDTRDGRLSRLALGTSSEEYVRGFGKLVGNQGQMSALESDEQSAIVRAMSLTDSAGGYLVPFQLDPNVINTADGSFNQVRQAARTVIATGDKWHGVSSDGVSGGWAAEAAEADDNSPTLAQPTITIHKLQIFVPISIEALQDAQNVAQEVAEMIAFKKDELESTAFVNGSGDASNQPYGLITRLAGVTNSKVNTTTADTFGLADLYKLDESLPARYRMRASWLAHRAIYNDVRQFDTSGGAALWERLGADVPAQLIGRPAYESEAMASTPSGTNNLFLVFGDFQNYVIADRIGTTVEFIPHLFGSNQRPTGQRGWYAYARVGADSVNSKAFRVLDGQ